MKSVPLLLHLLNQTIDLSLKTQNFHWNVVGPSFLSLHTLFGTQYSDLISAADTIAERIRALDTLIPPDYPSKFDNAVDPIPTKSPKYTKMLEILGVEHEKLASFCATASNLIAEEDPASANLLADRQTAHQKAAWMLRSHLN